MEVYVALYDYEKEREDILSFKEGDKFRIASKADSRWWAAYALSDGDYGYVPSKYLEPYVDPIEGELAQQLSESSMGDKKRVTLEELRNTVPRAPVSASNILSDEEEEEQSTDPVIIKPLTVISQPANDAELVEPKRLPNPHLESKLHRQLNKEIKFNSARGGAQNLGKPELEIVMRRRRADQDGKPGPIKPNASPKTSRSCDDELASQLARRTQLMEEAEKEEETELNKPEFLKVSLRKTSQVA